MAKKSTLTPVPPGFRSVTPYLAVKGGKKASEFYTKAFGAKEIRKNRNETPDGKLLHSRVKIGDSLVMISDVFGPEAENQAQPMSQVTLHVYTRDVDKMWKDAVEAGATVLMPLDNTFWGESYGQLIDPFGHR